MNQKNPVRKPKGKNKVSATIRKDGLSCMDLMNKQVISVAPSESIINAIEILQKKKIRHLPIIENERVVGIISDRDTRQVLAILQVMGISLEQARGDLRVSEFMASPVTTIESKASAMSAAKILIRNKIGCLPVMENGKVAGIITETDIMKRFIKEHGY